MFLECWLKIGFLWLDCLNFIQIVRLIVTHSLSIACYSQPPQSFPFINATTKVCYFPLIFFFFFLICLAYLCIKYMIVGHHKTFLKVVQKGFTIWSMNLHQNYWKKMELFNQILLAFSLNIVATKDCCWYSQLPRNDL